MAQVYRSTTNKPVERFVADLTEAAAADGFQVHNPTSMAMAGTFAGHGIPMDEGFDLHMVQLCKPQKAAASLAQNPERAVLMPKFVMAFSDAGVTQVRFLYYAPETVRALVDDPVFPASLAESCAQIIACIEAAS